MSEIDFSGLLIVAAVASRCRSSSASPHPAALLQATLLSFMVAASMIGIDLGLLDAATGAALIAAGLLSVPAFPLLALTLLRRGQSRAETRIAAAPHPTTP